MDSEALNQVVLVLGTVGGVALVVALLVQFLIKPALYARYGGEEAAHQNQAYPFTVNVLTFVTALLISAIGLFAIEGLPMDASQWALAGGNILVGAVFASFASPGLESVASNVKRLLLK